MLFRSPEAWAYDYSGFIGYHPKKDTLFTIRPSNIDFTINDSQNDYYYSEEDGSLNDFSQIEPLFKFTCNKEWNHFLEISEECTPFNILCNLTKEIVEEGVLEEIIIYSELRGMKDGKCTFYYEYRILNVYPVTSSGISNTIIEINRNFNVFRGKKIICYYPSEELIEKLNKMKEGIVLDLSEGIDDTYCNEITSGFNTDTNM